MSRDLEDRVRVTQAAALVLLLCASVLLLGCGSDKEGIRDDDPEAVVALKQAGARVKRVPNMSAPNMLGRNIDMTDTDLDPGLFEHLGNVEGLTELKLTGPNVTDETLANLPEIKSATVLDLSGANVTDEGLVHLESLPSVFSLNLSDTKVTAAGLVNLRPVAILTLSNLPIGDKDLENLKHMKGLRILTLDGTHVTAAGVKKFKQGRPGLLTAGIKLN